MKETQNTQEGNNMARFLAQRYTMIATGRCEYRCVMFGRMGWFDANSTDDAIEMLHTVMDDATYILKIQTENGYKPFYKAIRHNDAIRVLRDDR
jgi:hypothetical protein